MAKDTISRAADALTAYRRGDGPHDPRARELCSRLMDALNAAGTVGPQTAQGAMFMRLGLSSFARRNPAVRAEIDALSIVVAESLRSVPLVPSAQDVKDAMEADPTYIPPPWVLAPAVYGLTAPPSRFTVLFAAASPEREDMVRVDRQARAVREALEGSGLRKRIDLEVRMAVRPPDFLQALLAHSPRVVHFAGHGKEETGELCFEDDDGGPVPADTDGLRVIFSQLRGTVECVILNARQSYTNADAILASVPYVIAMRGVLEDAAATVFSTGFYQALGERRSVPAAFEFARGLLKMMLRGQDPPELLTPGW